MNLKMYVAKTAKKMVQINCENGNSVGVFKDQKEEKIFYCVIWMKKDEECPQFKFFACFENAIEFFKIAYEVIK